MKFKFLFISLVATDHELEPLVCDTVDAGTTHEK